MIPRIEFYQALSLAVATAASPIESNPLPDRKKLADEMLAVCIDFWPNNGMRIVGTNGKRLVVSYLTVRGLPNKGRFIIPLDKAAELMLTFGCLSGRVTLGLFGENQMMFTGGEDYAIVDAAASPYPEYHQVLEGAASPTSGAVYDGATLRWILEQVAPVSAGPLAIQMRSYGSTIIRPKLRDGLECLNDVLFAIQPLTVLS